MKTNYFKHIVALTFAAFLFFNCFSQISDGGKPYGYSKDFSLKAKEQNDTLNDINKAKYFLSDSVVDLTLQNISVKSKCGQENYAKNIAVNVDFFEDAFKIVTDDSTEVWTMKIESSNAYGYHLIFSDFYLPKGCKLYIYNEDHTFTLGAFTSRNNRTDNRFVTQHINGKSIYVELSIPANTKESPVLQLEKAAFIYKDIFITTKEGEDFSCMKYTPCNNLSPDYDPLTWETQLNSVFLIQTTDGNKWNTCTGTLINKENNYLEYERPFMITAAHCLNVTDKNNYSEPAKLEDCIAVFKYESETCDGDTNNGEVNDTKSAVGFTEIEKNESIDFTMWQLDNEVGELLDYDITFSGWDLGNDIDVLTNNLVGIHHPGGRSKSIAIDNNYPVSGTYIGNVPNSHHHVNFDVGDVWHGSSGSALFNENKKIIGTLSGHTESGDPAPCDEKGTAYCKLSMAWETCDLSFYLTPLDRDRENLESYSPSYAYEPISYELPVEISTNPRDITTETQFIVKATAGTTVSPPIHWYLWINKNPNDLNTYNYGSNMCYSFEQHTGLDGEFASDFFTQFYLPGTYKGTLYVYDGDGKQSTNDFSITIAESSDPCIYAFINDSNNGQFVYPKGSNICLLDYCYVTQEQSYYLGDDCISDIRFGELYQPKYQGISLIQWKLGSTLERNVPFYTTFDFQHQTGDAHYPSTPRYYYAEEWGFPTHVELTKLGLNTVTLNAWAGKMDVRTDGFQGFIHPFPDDGNHGPQSVTKSFYVVDCESVWYVGSQSQLETSNEEYTNTKGTINVNPPSEGLSVAVDNPINWTAYNKIVFNIGFSTEPGASLIATAKICPESHDCNNNKSIEIKNDENPLKEDLISIYPNPAIDEIKISGARHYSYHIYDAYGKLIKSGKIVSDLETISAIEYVPGIYLIKLSNYSSKQTVTKRIVIFK